MNVFVWKVDSEYDIECYTCAFALAGNKADAIELVVNSFIERRWEEKIDHRERLKITHPERSLGWDLDTPRCADILRTWLCDTEPKVFEVSAFGYCISL